MANEVRRKNSVGGTSLSAKWQLDAALLSRPVDLTTLVSMSRFAQNMFYVMLLVRQQKIARLKLLPDDISVNPIKISINPCCAELLDAQLQLFRIQSEQHLTSLLRTILYTD
jgi:hypothetical protein